MRYLLIMLVFIASCTSSRKSVKQQKKEINKSLLSFRDSIRRLTTESSSTALTTGWVTSSTDSGYDKVIVEEVKEVIDSGIIRRETIRTIKEKGQKRTEQLSHTSKFDSSDSMITEHSQLQELEKEDSSAVVMTTQKDVKRTSFLPWWIWLIVAVVAVLAWWQRNPIIAFLRSK